MKHCACTSLLMALSAIACILSHCLPVFRKIHTESAKVWLDKLGNVPLLVCLTFADKLYAEHMTEDGKHPDKEFMKFEIEAERSVSYDK